jgi:hypothetical protein
VAVLEHLAESCGVCQTSRLTEVGTNTVVRYSLLAGEHAEQLHDELVAFPPNSGGPAGPGGGRRVLAIAPPGW